MLRNTNYHSNSIYIVQKISGNGFDIIFLSSQICSLLPIHRKDNLLCFPRCICCSNCYFLTQVGFPFFYILSFSYPCPVFIPLFIYLFSFFHQEPYSTFTIPHTVIHRLEPSAFAELPIHQKSFQKSPRTMYMMSSDTQWAISAAHMQKYVHAYGL